MDNEKLLESLRAEVDMWNSDHGDADDNYTVHLWVDGVMILPHVSEIKPIVGDAEFVGVSNFGRIEDGTNLAVYCVVPIHKIVLQVERLPGDKWQPQMTPRDE
jgi:hypothetical protein